MNQLSSQSPPKATCFKAVLGGIHTDDGVDSIRSTESSNKHFPSHYTPGNYDVIIGRKRSFQQHVGNQRLRFMVAARLEAYSAAQTRKEKSDILMSVVSDIRSATPEGGFVKHGSSGLWFDVGDVLAREKVSQAFRDALHTSYRSSSAFKRKKRATQKISSKMTSQTLECLNYSTDKHQQGMKIQPFLSLFRCASVSTLSSNADSNSQNSCEGTDSLSVGSRAQDPENEIKMCPSTFFSAAFD